MPLVFLVHRYSHQAFTVFGRVPNMEIDHTLEQQLQPILFHKTSRHLVIYVYKIHDRSSCDIQIIEVDIDIVIKTQCLIMIAVCRGGNTDLKCPSSTLQRVF